ncbi:hypothetical protein ELS17_09675 [Natrinema altunense]|uniref:Uncharacterized protein n=1 Tax=Natrinema altunense TaxID=222984 RepID=A0A482XZ21_9EURY|nr:hypothetical protein ELS17_09675 [Natrinema altunense]
MYDDYSHHFKGVTAEFTQRVNDIGITTAAAAIAVYIESAGVGIVVTVIGGVIALISDTDSVTVGINEIDTVFGKVPNQKVVGVVGYGVTVEVNSSHRRTYQGSSPPDTRSTRVGLALRKPTN